MQTTAKYQNKQHKEDPRKTRECKEQQNWHLTILKAQKQKRRNKPYVLSNDLLRVVGEVEVDEICEQSHGCKELLFFSTLWMTWEREQSEEEKVEGRDYI